MWFGIRYFLMCGIVESARLYSLKIYFESAFDQEFLPQSHREVNAFAREMLMENSHHSSTYTW